jgi:hypothetical protein
VQILLIQILTYIFSDILPTLLLNDRCQISIHSILVTLPFSLRPDEECSLLAPSEAHDSAFLEILSGAPISHASLSRNRPTKASYPVSHEPYCRLSVEMFSAFVEPPDFLWLVLVDVFVNVFLRDFFSMGFSAKFSFRFVT